MKSITQEELDQFTGTENYYKHWLGGIYTDGVKFLAERAGAYWLIDAIFSHLRRENFQEWTLKKYGVDLENELLTDKIHQWWVLSMREDIDRPDIVFQKIEYRDFPLPEITLYQVDNILMLPSEY